MIGALAKNYYWTDKVYNRNNRKQLFMFRYRMQRLFTGYNYKPTPSFLNFRFKSLKRDAKIKHMRKKYSYHKQLKKSMNFVFTHVKSYRKKRRMRKNLLLKKMRKNARLWAHWAPLFYKDPLLINNEVLLYNAKVVKFLGKFRDGLHSLLLFLFFLSLLVFFPFKSSFY